MYHSIVQNNSLEQGENKNAVEKNLKEAVTKAIEEEVLFQICTSHCQNIFLKDLLLTWNIND
jgi:hypothetical protein